MDKYIEKLSSINTKVKLYRYYQEPTYNERNSLLYMAISEMSIDFYNGKPHTFIYYKIIVAVGSSKNINDPVGMAPIVDGKMAVSECNFYTDFFINYPKSEDDFQFIHQEMKFSNIPRYAIINIEKVVNNINVSDKLSLETTINLLKCDRDKIDNIRMDIAYLMDRLKRLTDALMSTINHKQEILDNILSIRGGSYDKYTDMIQEYQELTYHTE
jgi:hypothetical protein